MNCKKIFLIFSLCVGNLNLAAFASDSTSIAPIANPSVQYLGSQTSTVPVIDELYPASVYPNCSSPGVDLRTCPGPGGIPSATCPDRCIASRNPTAPPGMVAPICPSGYAAVSVKNMEDEYANDPGEPFYNPTAHNPPESDPTDTLNYILGLKSSTGEPVICKTTTTTEIIGNWGGPNQGCIQSADEPSWFHSGYVPGATISPPNAGATGYLVTGNDTPHAIIPSFCPTPPIGVASNWVILVTTANKSGCVGLPPCKHMWTFNYFIVECGVPSGPYKTGNKAPADTVCARIKPVWNTLSP